MYVWLVYSRGQVQGEDVRDGNLQGKGADVRGGANVLHLWVACVSCEERQTDRRTDGGTDGARYSERDTLTD